MIYEPQAYGASKDFLPTYYQACKGSSPIKAAVEIFGLCMPLGPTLLIVGGSIQATKRYRVQIWIGWVLIIVASLTLSTVDAKTPVARVVGFSVFQGVGMGVIYASTYFPVLAPLPVSENAHALAFFSFCRSFALVSLCPCYVGTVLNTSSQVWGVTIGTAVLQTQLSSRLPAEFVAQFPQGVSIAYSSVPIIVTLAEPLRSQVQDAFAQSIAVIWKVNIGIALLGFLSSLVMEGLPLHTETDDNWGVEKQSIRLSQASGKDVASVDI